MEQQKGFLASLFDLSCTEFITLRVIRPLYVLAMVLGGLMWLVLVIGSSHKSPGQGLVAFVIGSVALVLVGRLCPGQPGEHHRFLSDRRGYPPDSGGEAPRG